MSITPGKFVRKPFAVEALQVTEENLEEVATWCGGKVRQDEDGQKYVKVQVKNALNARQTEARPGCWVLKSGEVSFKVYGEYAFTKSFQPETEPLEVTVYEAPPAKPNRAKPSVRTRTAAEQEGTKPSFVAVDEGLAQLASVNQL